jgi:HEAT repeat protein
MSTVAFSQNPAKASLSRLLSEFQNTHVFWEQFEVAEAIVALNDRSVLPELEAQLSDEDRHLRGNAAFIFARLGDERGFDVISAMLTDRSDRPEGQGMVLSGGGISAPGAPPQHIYHVKLQIAADRYYAAHLLGDIKDPRGVPILIPLLDDPEVNEIVPWALAKIGDKRAIKPLINALANSDPSMRVLAIFALDELKAKEAIPALQGLSNDNARSSFGDLVRVADAADEAITHLEASH